MGLQKPSIKEGIWGVHIPDICHFFYTGRIFKYQILLPKTSNIRYGVQEGVVGKSEQEAGKYFSKKVRQIFTRDGEIFLQEMKKYLCKRWRNIFTRDGEIFFARDGKIFLQEMEKYIYKRWRNIFSRDGKIFLQEMEKYRLKQGNMQAVLVQAATLAISVFQVLIKLQLHLD